MHLTCFTITDVINIHNEDPDRCYGGIQDVEVKQTRAKLHLKLNQVGEARELYISILNTDNNDDWISYRGLLDTLHLVKEKEELREGTVSVVTSLSSVNAVLDVFKSLQTKVMSDTSIPRGPFLAGMP